jgi:transposase
MLEEDEPLLRDLLKKCKDVKEIERYAALHGVSVGVSVSQISRILDVEESTIYDWINKWTSERSIKDKPRSGRPPLITKEDEKEIKDLLDENDPKKHGINASSYTTAVLQEYFLKIYGRLIDEETFRVHLRRTGARYVKAQLRYKEADERKQIEFARNFLTLATTYGFARILFIDEMSVSTSARSGYGWTYGQRLVVNAPQSNNERANYFGAVEVSEGEVIETVRKDAKTPSFLFLLHKIEQRYPNDKTLVMMDNSKVHHGGRVAKFFEKRENMKLLFLPPYSPEINPEEYMNGYLKHRLLDNRNFRSVRQIGHAISRFVKRLKPEEIKDTATLIPIEALLSAPKVL